MSEYTILKQWQFDDRVVTLLRSNTALRKWLGKTEFRTGERRELVVEDEKEAYRRFYTECEAAMNAERARWEI